MQRRIAQIVDSAGSIPREILDKYQISEVAFHILLGENQYRENITISSQEFFEHMQKQRKQVPQTSIPGSTEWLNAFEEKYADGYRDFIVTTIAKPLSASIQSASMAADEFKHLHPDINICIMESNTCACGQAALEIKIAELIEQNQLPFEDLIRRIEEFMPRVVSLFCVNELTYMQAGGRIGGAAAFLGKLINIKPVCEFVNGVVHPIKPVRSRQKALQTLVSEAVKRVTHAEDIVVCVQDALCKEDADFLIQQLRERLKYDGPIYQSPVGAVIGSHSGPNAIGIGIVQG
jgi:DegV family protein with EDD domain